MRQRASFLLHHQVLRHLPVNRRLERLVRRNQRRLDALRLQLLIGERVRTRALVDVLDLVNVGIV